jgi:hypothetical protein
VRLFVPAVAGRICEQADQDDPEEKQSWPG